MRNRYLTRSLAAFTAMAVGGLLLAGTASAETDAQKIARLETELAQLKAKVGPIADMEGTPLKEIRAIAGVISPEIRGLTIDLSGTSGEYCLRDPAGGNFMVHFSEHPAGTAEDILYFIAAETLTGAGLNAKSLPPLPALGQMKPRSWYYYDGESVEPHHQRKLGKAYLVLAVDVR